MRLHLCGPMRGLPRFNFEAFSAAAAALRAKGHTVTVPTEHDRAVGFDPFKGEPPSPGLLHRMVAWNLGVIAGGQQEPAYLKSEVNERGDWERPVFPPRPIDGVVLLTGWHQSEGAKLEALVAERCGRALYLFDFAADGFLIPIPAGTYRFDLHTPGVMPAWEPA